MEENIKRVEKLVHATNSALAQMKFSLMFDDMSGGKRVTALRPEDFDQTFLDKLIDKDDLKRCQDEFESEANEMLAKVDKLFSFKESNRTNSKALRRIKEINKKKNIKLEQSKPQITEQSRQKLLSLISEQKFSPGVNSSKESVDSKTVVSFDREKEYLENPHSALRKIDSVHSIAKTPIETKVELKKKILETQEIVDKGFLTARQLAQKMECMTKCDRKEKTPSIDQTVSENNLRSLGSKTESNETIGATKCKRHSIKKKNKEKIIQEVERPNSQVIDVKREDFQKKVKSNLQLQRLPSVQIKGGLKLQKIHNLEIPACEEKADNKTNTAISFLSHEQMEKEKLKKILEEVRRINCCCTEENIRKKYVECFNCGKLIRIQEACVDPQKLDEILRECNFNVFDPRIDEFVEKFGAIDFENFCEKTRLGKQTAQSLPLFIPDELEVRSKNFSEKLEAKNQLDSKKNRQFTLRELSNKLFKKYRQEVETLEYKHIKLDNLLENLFRKVDESREVLDDCYFIKNLKSVSKKIPHLTVTTPILVTLRGNSLKNRKTKKKLGKENFKIVNKSRIKSQEIRIKQDEKLISGSSTVKSLEANNNVREGLFSLIQFTQKDNIEPLQRRTDASSGCQSGKTEHPGGKEEVNEKSSVELTSSSSSSNLPEKTLKRKHTGKTLIMASIFRKTRKPVDEVLSKEEVLSDSFLAAPTSKDEINTPLKTREGRVKQKKTSSPVTFPVSSNESRTICFNNSRKNKIEEPKTHESTSLQTRTVKTSLRRDEIERELLVASSENKIIIGTEEKPELFERSLEKSENNYESDFESFTNEPEGKGDDCEEEEEPQVITCVKKLSTISEVDSELEKKISEEQKSSKNTNCDTMGARKISGVTPHERNMSSIISEISNQTKKPSEAFLKNVPTELMTSLKDILSALQDQFARTESLTDKLTENIKAEKKENNLDLNSAGNFMSSSWKMATPAKMVENLQSTRKDRNCALKSSLPLFIPEKLAAGKSEQSEISLPADSLSDEGGSSLGEIIVSEGRMRYSGKSGSSSISEMSCLNLDGRKKSTCVSSGCGDVISSFSLKLLT